MPVVLLFIIFVLLLIIAIPVSITLGISSVLPSVFDPSFTVGAKYLIRAMFGGLDSFPLLAVPMFVLSGIIMAKGTITLEPGAKLISSPLDAAKAFQSQINADGTSPKDFFWEGDKYVLGNSQSSDDNKNTDKDSSFYHVEDYVNYKNWKKM